MATMATSRPSHGGLVAVSRVAAAIAVAVGAAWSLGLMYWAGSRAPWVLLAMFLVWVVSPFVALAWAMVTSSRWRTVPPPVVHALALAVTAGSLATYTGLIAPPAHSPNAFIYIVVPGIAWVAMLLAWIVALATRHRGSR
jgi:hypothetical protein